jgi:hypothetical protein
VSALRYSGEVTIRVTWIDKVDVRPHGGHYRCTLSRIESNRRVTTTQYVGAPACLTHAIDCSEAFDDTAHAALSFASNRETAEDDDPNGWAEVAAYKADGSGWLIARAPAKRWGKEVANESAQD